MLDRLRRAQQLYAVGLTLILAYLPMRLTESWLDLLAGPTLGLGIIAAMQGHYHAGWAAGFKTGATRIITLTRHPRKGPPQ